jgi:hypothetical protein
MAAETQTVDLAAWLTEIWDEEERLAKAAAEQYPGQEWNMGADDVVGAERGGYVACGAYGGGISEEIGAHIVAHDPASVLARVAADRKILELHMPSSELCFWTNMSPETHEDYGRDCFPDGTFVCETLRLLAWPYADRADYREEWKP